MIRSMATNATGADTRKSLAMLKAKSTRAYRDGMARYGLPSDNALGVPVGAIRAIAKQLGRNHKLALALWKTGVFEARMLATMVDDPAEVTPAQMDQWTADFDNWGICDTACFVLFDRTPHVGAKIRKWAPKKEEFVRRTAFALMASAALHDKDSDDKVFLKYLPLIERAAADNRNFVKKGVSWALRSIGSRSVGLHKASIALAAKLAKSEDSTERWIGRDALNDLQRPLVAKRVAGKTAKREAAALKKLKKSKRR